MDRSTSCDPAQGTTFRHPFAPRSAIRGRVHGRRPHGHGMRIAIITESFPPDVNGVAHSVVRVAEHLLARGHEPMVIAPAPASGRRAIVGQTPYPVLRVASVPTPRYRGFRLGLPSRSMA